MIQKKHNRLGNEQQQKDEVVAAIKEGFNGLTRAVALGFVLLAETRPGRTLDDVRSMHWYQDMTLDKPNDLH